MFEKDIKFIADFSLNKIKNLGSFFTYEKLAKTDVHPAVIKYISAELDFLIYEDRQKILQNSVFDYSGSEIAKYFNLIGDEIKKTKKISYEDIRKLVIQAVSFNANFVIRPKWSLLKLIFGGKAEKHVDEIKLMLNSLYYYEYLKNICLAYLDKKNLAMVSRPEFEVILNKIDKELFTKQNRELTENALISISDFFNVGGMSKNKIAPASIELFLKEKNLVDYLFRLRKALPVQTKQKVELDDIRKILYSRESIDETVESTASEYVDESVELDKNEITNREELGNTEVLNDEENNFEQASLAETENEEEPLAQNIDEDEYEIIDEDEKEIEEEILDDFDENDRKEYLEENVENENISSEEDEDLLAFYNSELESLDQNEELDSDANKLSDLNFEEENEAEEFDEVVESDTESNRDELLNDFTESEETLDHEYQEEEFELETETNDNSDFSLGEEKEDSQEFDEENQSDEDYLNEDKIENEESGEEDSITETRTFEKDLFNYLSNKDIEKIVSSVFNEDREDFVSSLEKVMECNSYDEATEILKGIYLTYRVNPYSKDAVILTNAVSNYFNQA